MGLLFSDESTVNVKAEQEAALFHRMGCRACPLRNEPGRIEPTGAEHPVIYALGEAPGKTEVEEQSQFVGEAGELLRPRIPREWLPKMRWNNVVRSRPPKNRTPERPEIEACRPSIIQDIERSKPQAIFGFGNVPLTWVSGFTGITMWRGRRMPVRVGNHACWYYAMLHPSYLLRQRRGDDRNQGGLFIGSEEERMYVFDLKRAFADVKAGLPAPLVHDEAMARRGVETLFDVPKIVAALAWASQQKVVGVDYETNGLRPYIPGAKILTAAVGTPERSFAFPIWHREARFSDKQRSEVISAWELFLASEVRKYVHNLAFELEWSGFFYGLDCVLNDTWEDTATQASIIDERRGKKTNTGGPFSLEFLCQQRFGLNVKKLSNVNRKDIDGEPLPKVLEYNAIDAKYHLLLGLEQEQVIHEKGLDYVYALARRRVPTVVVAQLRGIPVNQQEVKRLQTKYGKRIKKTEAHIQAIPVVQSYKRGEGKEFNPHSAPEVIEIFHKYLKRRECVVQDKYSKQQKLSADDTVLEQIDHPLARAMQDLRGDTKTKSTYIDPMDAADTDTLIYPDGLLHTNYNTFFAETGRLSAEGPNVQNYPKRDAETKEVRGPIEAFEDCTILAFDYGQIQARIVGMFSKDRAFCKALWERYDIHQDWTERLATDYPQRIGGRKMLMDWKSKGEEGKKAMKDFRTDVKNQFSFPLLFGAQLKSVAGYLGMPEHIVRPHYNAFWKQFSEVKEWQEDLMAFYNKYGYVECLTGRRRRGPLSPNKVINTPVQGTEAEIVMEGMCTLVETGDPELIPELMVHDDLTFLRVRKNRAEQVAEKVLDILLDPPFDWINVPLTIELLSGQNWMPYDEQTNPKGLQEIGTFSSDSW